MIFLLLFAGLLDSAIAAHKDVVARSDFHWGEEDWTVFGPGRVEIYARGGLLYGSDKGRKVWYFRAPEAFTGDKCFAHNGELSFRLGHSEYMSNGKDMIRDWDVILESKLWKLRFGVKNLVPPWVGSSRHTLSLNEQSWTNIASGHPPTTIEMLRLLTAVSGLYIRGGYYDGHEETWIDEVQISEGDHKEDVLLRRIEKHAIHPSNVKEPEPPAPPPEPDAHLDEEEKIARRLAKKAAEEEEAKLRAAQIAVEEQNRIAAEHVRKLAEAEEKEVAKVLEHQHELKGDKEGYLTAEEIEYAVDQAEKELLQKMMQQQQEEVRLQSQRDELAKAAHADADRRAAEVDKEVSDAHEHHLEDKGHRNARDVHDLHAKAHSRAHERHAAEHAHEHGSKHAVATPAPTPAPHFVADDKASPDYDGDIDVDEAARIASAASSSTGTSSSSSPNTNGDASTADAKLTSADSAAAKETAPVAKDDSHSSTESQGAHQTSATRNVSAVAAAAAAVEDSSPPVVAQLADSIEVETSRVNESAAKSEKKRATEAAAAAAKTPSRSSKKGSRA